MKYLKLNLAIFFALMITIKSSEGNEVTVNCKYLTVPGNDIMSSIYSCSVQNSADFNGERKSIAGNTGKHSGSYTNAFVKGFQLTKATGLTHFPTKLESVFKKLIMIEISDSESLTEFTQSDLKVFKELEYLNLHNNKIQFITNDVFAANFNLKIINLSNNKISHIESGSFNGLSKLQALYLSNNLCKSLNFADKRTGVEVMVENINKGECTSYEVFVHGYKKLAVEIEQLKDKAVKDEETIEKISKEKDEWKNAFETVEKVFLENDDSMK